MNVSSLLRRNGVPRKTQFLTRKLSQRIGTKTHSLLRLTNFPFLLQRKDLLEQLKIMKQCSTTRLERVRPNRLTLVDQNSPLPTLFTRDLIPQHRNSSARSIRFSKTTRHSPQTLMHTMENNQWILTRENLQSLNLSA